MSIVRSQYWNRVGGVAGIPFFISILVLITLLPLTHSVSEPAFDAPSSALLAYARSEANLPFALELVRVAGLWVAVASMLLLRTKSGP